MNKAEALSGAVFAAIGGFMLLHALKLAYIVDDIPGPGFLPRWIAAGLIATGSVLVLKALRPKDTEPTAWPGAAGWLRVILVLAALGLAFVALTTLGFLVTTTLFVGVVIFGLGVRSKVMLATVPLLAAIVLYVVFAVCLSVPLPKGVLEGFAFI
ncbi:MAG TPA: tripartite tricarboxylate transporter TctB family protein [Burkholderiales bacterium]|nr:tripartite tricarboxylate transporter TctB family protein [Burkholderiales bacterium]